jgi:hypothetical protein
MFRAIVCSSSGGQNCISTVSGIVTLYERPCIAPVESGLPTLMLFQVTQFVSCTTQNCTEPTAEGRTYRVLSLPSGIPTPSHARGRVGESTESDNPVLSDKIMNRYVTIQFLLLSKHMPSSLQTPYI